MNFCAKRILFIIIGSIYIPAKLKLFSLRHNLNETEAKIPYRNEILTLSDAYCSLYCISVRYFQYRFGIFWR